MKYLYPVRDLKQDQTFTFINESVVWVCVANNPKYCLVTAQNEEGQIINIEYLSYVNSDREKNVMVFDVPDGLDVTKLTKVKNMQSGVIHLLNDDTILCGSRFMQNSVTDQTLLPTCDKCLALLRKGQVQNKINQLLKDVKLAP
jgi:hypothetical protein